MSTWYSLIILFIATNVVIKTFKHFYPLLAKDPLKYASNLSSSLYSLSDEQKIAVYKYFNMAGILLCFLNKNHLTFVAIEHLAKTNISLLDSFIKNVPVEISNEAVTHLLGTPKLVDDILVVNCALGFCDTLYKTLDECCYLSKISGTPRSAMAYRRWQMQLLKTSVTLL